MNAKLAHDLTSPALCTARIDRIIIAAHPNVPGPPPRLPAPFHNGPDTFVKQQTSIRTYQRCRQIMNDDTGTEVYWQYSPAPPWLPPSRITFVADDRGGLPPEDVLAILEHCQKHTVLLAEIAFDFAQISGVDQGFILRHGIFGKSRRRRDRGGDGTLRYGGRTSSSLVRAYHKTEINRYRVELELHSRFFRSSRLCQFRQLSNLRRMLLPSRFQLVKLDWHALSEYLFGRVGARSTHLLMTARGKQSIHASCQYLRRQGVLNTHRFLRPLQNNADLQSAINVWAATFEESINEN